jgi:REP element-mobilizing transposase RayT
MANHVHLVIGVPGDPDPTKVLGDFKAYGSRALTGRWGRPPSGTWWTYAGSKRRLKDEASVFAAVTYIREQEYPLCLRVDPAFVNAEGT